MRDYRQIVLASALATACTGATLADPVAAELSAIEAAIVEQERQLPNNNAALVQSRRDIAEQATQELERGMERNAAALQEIKRGLMDTARARAETSIPTPMDAATTSQPTAPEPTDPDAADPPSFPGDSRKVVRVENPRPENEQQPEDVPAPDPNDPYAVVGAPPPPPPPPPPIDPDDEFQLIDPVPNNPAEGDTSPNMDKATLAAEGFFSIAGLGEPLAGEINGLKRRILSRPDAMLVNPDGSEAPLDTFSIHYVFADKEDRTGRRWLAVGARIDQPEGWVLQDATEDWKTMLVMEYAPLTTERQRVLFFSDKKALEEIIQDTSGADAVKTIYAEVEQRRDAGGRVVSIEPRRSVAGDKPYLMPILDHETSYFNYGSYADVTLLKLAGLTEDASSREGSSTKLGDQDARTKDPDPETFSNFKIRLAFVIDTTRSMGPYIEATKDFVRSLCEGLDRRGLLDRVRFGLVGFRDDPNAAPGVEYLTRVFTTFDTPADLNRLFADVDAMQSANVPTADWREDAFAGLRSAIKELDWREGDAKFLLLITDASARSETDPKASLPNFGPNTARQMLDQQGISLYALHINSDEARRASGDGEINRARFQYQSLGSYWGLDGSDHRVFSLAIERFRDQIMRTVIDAAGGRELRVEPPDASNEFDEYSVIMDFQSGLKLLTEDSIEILDKPTVSDLFRFQQEYLAMHEGVEPPKFYRAWSADHDLVTPTEQAMNVKVLVSRAQLELLAATLEDTIAGVDDKRTNLSEFHLDAQAESGRASTDPRLEKIDVSAFLEALPYKSKLLQLTGSDFRNYGQGQEDLLNEVRAKLRGYREVLSSNKRWMRVSERSEEELYPLPLRDLP